MDGVNAFNLALQGVAEDIDYPDENENDIPDLPIISLYPETIFEGDWMMEPLYRKEGSKIRIWYIFYNSEEHNLYIRHGFTGPNYKRQLNHHPVVTNTSGRSYSEQAHLEARARYLVKCRKDCYHPNPDENTTVGCMLAYRYKEGIIKRWPVYVDMKINGWRCKARWYNEEIELTTRGGKSYSWLKELRLELNEFLKYLPGGTELDGELWNKEYSRQKIQSILSTTERRHSLNSTIAYYIFDLVEPDRMPLNYRYYMLFKAYQEYIEDGNSSQYIRIVNKYEANSHEDIMKYHDYFVNEHVAEGAVVKKICSSQTWDKLRRGETLDKIEQKEVDESTYQARRCNSMYKVKNFIDEEGTIVDYDIAVGTQEGCIILKVKSKAGKIFKIGSLEGMELDERRALVKQGAKLIGTKLTYRYQELSEDGIPQHPVCESLRILD